MRILTAICTSYQPTAKSGADMMCERINTYLAAKGHDVITMIDGCQQDYTYKGVKVTNNRYLVGEKYDWCDVVITHLVHKGEAVQIAKRFNKPVFHVVHNGNGTTLPANTPDNYLIYNTYHLHNTSPHGLPSLVVQPPTWQDHWRRVSNGQYITLVNCVANKGHETMVQLARAMPSFKFMGVYGGYGNQLHRPISNIRYRAYTDNMQEIYNETRIIIVPSISESWSLVAAEAQACGIPVICSDLPGLRENMGDSAIYCRNTRDYMDGILKLQHPEMYYHYRNLGWQRQIEREQAHLQQLSDMEKYMQQVVDDKKGVEKVDIREVSLLPDGSYGIGYNVPREKVETPAAPTKEKKIITRPTTDRIK